MSQCFTIIPQVFAWLQKGTATKGDYQPSHLSNAERNLGSVRKCQKMTQNSSCQAVLPLLPNMNIIEKNWTSCRQEWISTFYSLPFAEWEKPCKKAVCEDTHSWERKNNCKKLRISNNETRMYLSYHLQSYDTGSSSGSCQFPNHRIA